MHAKRRSRRPGPARLVALAAVAAAAVAASGASGRTSHSETGPWATVNICTSAPPKLGIRAQMPGDGTHEQMYVRFTAQFRSGLGWSRLAGRGRSPWVHVGSAFNRFQQAGWTFGLARPAARQSYVLRGFVEYEWRAKHGARTVVVRRAHSVTAGGHAGTIGSKPRGHSSATCRISRR